MITEKCYFYNVGVTFDKNDKEQLKNVWNCNPLCCKSDLCNGLSCEEYGINFNKEYTLNFIKNYVEKGIDNTYGYIKETEVSLDSDTWNEINKYLSNNYSFSEDEIKEKGFICHDFVDIVEDNSSYWEQPDYSIVKIDGVIKENQIAVKPESELDKDTISWINEELYPTITKEMEV